MTIKRTPQGYGVRSKKGKNLGNYKTKKQAVRRIKQVEYFKRNPR